MICISHLPRSLSPLAHALITGLHLRAVMAGKYSERRMRGVPIFANQTDIELQFGDVNTEDMKIHVEEFSLSLVICGA